MIKELVIATHNKGKVEEFKVLLAELQIAVKCLDEFPEIEEPLLVVKLEVAIVGVFQEIDPDIVVPNRDLSILDGAIHASGWNSLTPSSFAMMLLRVVLPRPGGPWSRVWSRGSPRNFAASTKTCRFSTTLFCPLKSSNCSGRNAFSNSFSELDTRSSCMLKSSVMRAKLLIFLEWAKNISI